MSELTGRGREAPPDRDGCGFLAAVEVEALLDGSLSETRYAVLQRHARDGCGPCALLLVDADAFRKAAIGEEHADVAPGAARDASAIRAWLARQQHLPTRPKPWATAWRTAAVAAAAVIGVVFMTQRSTIESDEPAAITLPDGGSFAFTPMPFSPPRVLRGEPDLTTRWNAVGGDYVAGRYVEAARSLADLSQKDLESVDAPLYEGVAWLAAGRAKECLAALAEAQRRALGSDDDDRAIRWFQALALVRLNRIEEAQPILAGLAALPSLEGVPDAIDFPSHARRLLSALQGRTSTSNAPQ